ncbi:hypothetical protein BATDEDRAFT_91588 [Batrachochytrium dendrobatidis JAM81]|uniref:Uncharacterized protein n=1 Tax=Batrachochytrium dendrobatidis (strain JAM81 / FGSC 10211) TaxID=684364 RepID=F4PAU2_BATDJ|nr:uncharacterized protein BATDEDRAFT_91588 [Batrachochytrium dendrobatidis JAM81]EGF77602.1 hypothetical protein BATDEDRAFT_91588 [Batrachochytrium dendrobatidis JAM81]KAJ8323841.1 protein complex oligomerization [Batrachochytrium dendrobatidis]KAK5666243.1 protein complex oligomerization [Batrachochytrium dendrobatidis]|eukprot:XP_006681772.1 hypothetical protein BATDEDRAFT_91588 [Batrachochytrium dendrobatidis JAM81]
MQDILQVVKADWESRDFIRRVSHGILEMTEFLQKFEQHARQKIGSLDERLEKIERGLTTYEARITSLEPIVSVVDAKPSQA